MVQASVYMMRKENKLYYFGGKLGPNALKVIWKFQALNCFISFREKCRSNSLIRLLLVGFFFFFFVFFQISDFSLLLLAYPHIKVFPVNILHWSLSLYK